MGREGKNINYIQGSKKDVPFLKLSCLIEVAKEQKGVMVMTADQLLNFSNEREDQMFLVLWS